MGFLEHLTDPEQRSDEWHDIRVGRFTASQQFRLMAPVLIETKRDMTQAELDARPKNGEGSRRKTITMISEDEKALSKGAITYVMEKVAETITCIPKQTGSFRATEWGADNEEGGKQYFTAATGLKIFEVGFVPFLSMAGGTADGEIDEDTLFELKCPENSAIHLEYLENLNANTIAAWPEHYWQSQMNMLYKNKKRTMWATFDPRMPDDLKMKIIVMHADPVAQNRGLKKIDLAEALKQEKLLKFKNTQWKQENILVG
jgi:YqaJ-like viral recombinase domain